MELFMLAFYGGVGLAILNAILLLVALFKKQISLTLFLIIVIVGIFLPFFIAMIASASSGGLESIGKALIGYSYSLLLLMVFTLFYLLQKTKGISGK